MAMRRRGLWLGAASLLVAAGLVVVLLSKRSEPGPDADSIPEASSTDAVAPRPEVAGPDAASLAPAGNAQIPGMDAEKKERRAPGARTVRAGAGQVGVTLADGSAATSGFVRVVGWGGPDPLQTTRVGGEPVAIGADGTLSLATPEVKDPVGAWWVLVEAEGQPTHLAWVTAEDLSRGVVLEVPAGAVVSGRVTDRGGAPVKGLSLILTTAPTRSYAVTNEDLDPVHVAVDAPIDLQDAPALITSYSAKGGGQFVRTRTASDGRFAARVTPGRRFGLISDDESRIVWTRLERFHVPDVGLADLQVVASPAFTMKGTVADAGTAAALTPCRFAVEVRAAGPGDPFRFGIVADSPYRITWARTSDGRGIEVYDVSADVDKYVPEHSSISFAPGETSLVKDFRLRPIAAVGGKVKVALDVKDAAGAILDLPFFVEVRTPTPSPTVLSRATMVRGADGLYAAEVPPGDWDLRVVLPQHFYWMYSWHGRVNAEIGRDASVSCQVPVGSPLTVRWWAGATWAFEHPAIAFRKAGEERWSTESLAPGKTNEARFPAWPAGDWEFALGSLGSDPSTWAKGSGKVVTGTASTFDVAK